MKALTIREPWSWAISVGAKPVENRGWHSGYRGELAIHAGARSRWDPDGAASLLVRREWATIMGPGVPLDRKTELIPFGAIVALVTLADCHHASECRQDDAYLCSQWAAFGQYHFRLTGLRLLATPVPCRGALGLWTVPDDVERAVLAQLEESNA